MLFADWTMPDLASNLALDEALLLHAEAGGPAWLRLWEWSQYAVVLGAGGRLLEEIDAAACQTDGVSVARRGSGGGAVLLGPGCLLYSVVLPFDLHPALGEIQSSYRLILSTLADALQPLANGIAPAGTSDLAWLGRKCSGNSQQRKRHALLHHGTLLYDFDLKRMQGYLRMPPRQPEYRVSRGHGDFVTNLSATRTALTERLLGWGRLWGHTGEKSSSTEVRSEVEERATTLVAEKYGLREWSERR